jgi:hypothetical protein
MGWIAAGVCVCIMCKCFFMRASTLSTFWHMKNFELDCTLLEKVGGVHWEGEVHCKEGNMCECIYVCKARPPGREFR